MTPDPVTLFGGLLRGCISDRYLPRDKAAVAEGVAFVLLGVCSSFITTYILSAAGYLV